MKRESGFLARKQQLLLTDKTQAKDRGAVSRYLGQLKFAPRLFGVDEADVWKKIQRLCELYEDALEEEREKAERRGIGKCGEGSFHGQSL